ncbi:MAG: hypothetical protein RQ741_05055 [Wenzhouxiangellaceae bacterium]|nr:hypothetical protein [Wenzhouxiangellaceae bacterium]
MSKLAIVLAWAIAVVVAAALGSIAQTWINMNAIEALGTDVGLGQRISATLHDLKMFTPLYAGLVAAAFLVAWIVAGLLSRWQPVWRSLWFTLAGFLSIWTMLAVMGQALPVTAIAAARTTGGMLVLSLAGALGGWLYARLTREL